MGSKDNVGICIEQSTGMEIEIKGGEKIQTAIRTLSRFGLITFSREQDFKSSHYTIHFIKPKADLRNLYNLGNEMLIVCSSDGMTSFKSRTKDFIDYILTTREEYKNRLDKVTCFLIDGNKDVVSKVKNDRLDNPDARLIVPFCIEELQKPLTEDMLQERMRDFLYERDLFGMASPLNDETFFFGRNRIDTISELYGKYKQGEQGGLFGLRRIGKTSVLNLLKNRVNANGGLALYFDCSRYHTYRWNEFLEKISVRIHEAIDENKDSDSSALTVPLGAYFNDDRFNEKNAIDSFENDLEQYHDLLGKERILIILDEIESIGYRTSPSSHWKEGNDALFFWQALRSITQTNNLLFSFVVAGVNPMCTEISRINEYDNPIFGMVRPLYMQLFSYEDIKEMVNSIGGHLGLEFEEPLFSDLMSDYGGHPFLTRQICSKINNDLLRSREHRPFTITKRSYEVHSEEYQKEMIEVIQQILSVLEKSYPDEYDFLKILALDGYKAFKRELNDDEKTIPHLLGYCLIQKDESGYFIRIKSIEKYLEEKFVYDKSLSSQHEKRMRLNKRRDLLEIKLRDIIFYKMQELYGKKMKEKLIENIKGSTNDKSQEKKIMAATPREAMQELYFYQLKFLMLKDWKYYNKIFNDRNRFEVMFDVINESRGAGDHSRDISDEDETYYSAAFKFFENALEDY